MLHPNAAPPIPTPTLCPQAGDRVLVAEACNHNRITDSCNDIGLVQIPACVDKASTVVREVCTH